MSVVEPLHLLRDLWEEAYLGVAFLEWRIWSGRFLWWHLEMRDRNGVPMLKEGHIQFRRHPKLPDYLISGSMGACAGLMWPLFGLARYSIFGARLAQARLDKEHGRPGIAGSFLFQPTKQAREWVDREEARRNSQAIAELEPVLEDSLGRPIEGKEPPSTELAPRAVAVEVMPFPGVPLRHQMTYDEYIRYDPEDPFATTQIPF